jgi:hypothetical protein
MITAVLYETPPTIVSTTWGGSDGKGGIIGKTIGGQVTSQFPDAIVLLKLGGPANFNDETIRFAVKKNFVFRCGDSLSEGLPAIPFGKRIYIFRAGILTKSGTATLTSDQSDPSSESTELNLDIISTRGERWILALRYELAQSGDSKISGKSAVLLDRIIDVKATEPILIGFPYTDSQKRKFIYWLALSVDDAAEGLIH